MGRKPDLKTAYKSPFLVFCLRYIKRHKWITAIVVIAIILIVFLIAMAVHSYSDKKNEITLKASDHTFHRYVGDTVTPREFLSEVQGSSAIMLSFISEGGSYTFQEEGTKELVIIAVDANGNHAVETVHVSAKKIDREKPVISGTEDILIQKGDPFDVMEGIEAQDETDGKVRVTAVPKQIDTEEAGTYEIVYRASDRSGNEETIIRHVMVAEEMLTYEGEEFPVFWSTEGVGDHEYLIAVNRVQNTVTVYLRGEDGRYDVPYKAFVCSVGDDTPTGYYLTLERYRWKDLYEDSWGQYATRIVDHILFHSVPYYSADPSDLEYEEYNLLGTHASLGCVRLDVEDAKWIYDHTEEGFPCVIYDDTLLDGPLGKPESIKIDTTDEEKRGWDPTDPNEDNPWNQ